MLNKAFIYFTLDVQPAYKKVTKHNNLTILTHANSLLLLQQNAADKTCKKDFHHNSDIFGVSGEELVIKRASNYMLMYAEQQKHLCGENYTRPTPEKYTALCPGLMNQYHIQLGGKDGTSFKTLNTSLC